MPRALFVRFIYRKAVAVETVEPVVGAEPHEPAAVLVYRKDAVFRQPVGAVVIVEPQAAGLPKTY